MKLKNQLMLWIGVLVILIIGITIMTLTSAITENAKLTPIRQGSCMPLIQYCSDCTFVNITSITYPNGTLQPLNVVAVFQGGDSYVYNNFCSTNDLGTYIYGTLGNPAGTLVQQSIEREVTANGFILSDSQSIVYLVFLIAALFIFLLTLYGAIKIKWKSDKDPEGHILNINKVRYFKPFLMAMAYLELTFIFGILYSITSNSLTFDNVSPMFNWLYWLMLSFLFPIAVCTLIFSLIVFIQDRKLRKRISRGFHR